MYTDIKTLSDEALKAIKASIDAELKDRIEKTFEKDKTELIKNIKDFIHKYPQVKITAHNPLLHIYEVELSPYFKPKDYELKMELPRAE